MTTPLYAARVENLIPDRLIGVECLTCGHLSTIPALLVRAKLPAHTFVMKLPRYLRCDRCGERNARVVVGWALGIVENPLLSVTPEDARSKRL